MKPEPARSAGPASFLGTLSAADRAALLGLLSPDVRAAAEEHLERAVHMTDVTLGSDVGSGEPAGSMTAGTSAQSQPTGGESTFAASAAEGEAVGEQAEAGASAEPQLTSDDDAGWTPPALPPPVTAPPHAPLLSPAQLRLLLPTLLPEARRWLEEQQREGRQQGLELRQVRSWRATASTSSRQRPAA